MSKDEAHKKEPTSEVTEIPIINEDGTNLGDIKINHSVIASIVRIATLEVRGVIDIAGGGFDISEFLSKESERGIRVGETEGGGYDVEIRVILSFGVELAKTAFEIQQRVRDQIIKMTNKPAEKIDVIIEHVRNEDDEKSEAESANWQPSN